MNIFSIVLLIFIVLTLLTSSFKRRLLIFIIIGIVLDIVNLQGYFVKFGNKELSYRDFYTLFYLIYIIINSFFIKFENRRIALSFLFIVAGVWAIPQHFLFEFPYRLINSDSEGGWDLYVAGVTTKQYLQVNWFRFSLIYMRLISFCLTCIYIDKFFSKNDFLCVLKKVCFILSIIVVLYALIEFVSKNYFVVGIVNSFNDLLLGESANTYSFGDIRNGLYSLQGFSREPSHLSYALFLTLICYYLKLKLVRFSVSSVIIMILTCFLMIVSGAFSSLYYLSCSFLFFFIFSNCIIQRRKFIAKFFYLLLLIILLCPVCYLFLILDGNSYYSERLLSLLNNFDLIINDSWQGRVLAESQLIRLVSIVDVIKVSLHYPLFGIGCGFQWAHSGIATLFSCIGIVGIYLWIKLYCLHPNKIISFTALVVVVVVPNVMCGFVENMFSVSLVFVVYTLSNFFSLKSTKIS